MNVTLEAWNAASEAEALDAMVACCGSRRWAEAMVALRPIAGVAELSEAADRVWATAGEADWLEAFGCHPRIGERKAAQASAQSGRWSRQEQAAVSEANKTVIAEIAAGNALYEEKFGFAFIVCATGKTAEEMLAILNRRMGRERAEELREAAEQQRQITQIRLGKWLVE